MVMKALFAQRNFKETSILDDLYKSSSLFSRECRLLDDIRDQYLHINLNKVLMAPNCGVSIHTIKAVNLI